MAKVKRVVITCDICGIELNKGEANEVQLQAADITIERRLKQKRDLAFCGECKSIPLWKVLMLLWEGR